MQCPKCDYVRQPQDTAPSYECPSCGIVYAKYNPNLPSNMREREAKLRQVGQIAEPSKEASQQGSSAPAQHPDIVVIPGNLAVCQTCEEVGQVRTEMPGNSVVELLLYLFYLVPGIIYSVWRRQGKKQVCGACGSDRLVAAKTRAGLAIITAQFPQHRLERAEAGPRYITKRGNSILARVLWLLCVFAATGVLVLVAQNGLSVLAVMEFVFAVLCALGALNAAKPKQVETKPVGQGLVGW